MAFLEVKNLHVEVEDKKILNGLTLTVEKGQVAAIMGPNGSGKSTLAYVLAGKDNYKVTEGDVLLNGESILEMAPDERAAKGVFLAFQYPVEVPGVALEEMPRGPEAGEPAADDGDVDVEIAFEARERRPLVFRKGVGPDGATLDWRHSP